jgi:hypothetical protein
MKNPERNIVADLTIFRDEQGTIQSVSLICFDQNGKCMTHVVDATKHDLEAVVAFFKG